jgi:hypothetical protein
MKVKFMEKGNFGTAEYDPETGEYRWSYDGENERIIDLLKLLDDGPHFAEMVVGDVVSDDDEPVVYNEGYEIGDWEYQMERLAQSLRRPADKVKYEA